MKSGCHEISRPEADELVAELLVARAVAEVPLARRDDLERAVALLVELHRVGEGLRIADQLAGLLQQLDDALLGAEDRQAGELRVRRLRGIRHDRLRRLGDDASVLAEDRAVREVELAPPDDVGHVAERADHGDARALVGLSEGVREHGHLDVEDRGAHGRAEERLVPVVVRVGHERDARGEQFGTRRLDVDVARAVALVERDAVVRGLLVAVLELGLRDRRAEVDVPQRGRERLVRLAALEVLEERALARADRVVRDRAVGLGPVDAQAELAPQILEVLLVLDGEALAQLDEVAAADRHLIRGLAALVVAALVRRSEVRDVGQARVAAHAVVVLHAALGRQAVVVPAHRVEHRLAAHALVAHLHVGVRVAEHVADVQASGGRRRGSVDGEDALTADLGGLGAVEQVRSLRGPGGIPLVFETFEGGLVGNVSIGHGGLLVRYVRHCVSVPECGMPDDSSRGV